MAMINWQKLAFEVATLGLEPQVPAPGSIAAWLVCLGLFWLQFFKVCESYSVLVPLLVGLISLPIIQHALGLFSDSDPQQICLDEVVGMLVALYQIKLTWFTILLGFGLFRFFDIVKPLGLRLVERLPGAWGIVMDDVMAGLLTNIGMQLLGCYFAFKG